MKTFAATLVFVPCLFAQQPQIDNARVETRALQGRIQTELAQHGAGPFWAAWSEPIIPGRHGDMCWSNGNNDDGHAAGAPVRLEGQTTLLVLVRIENSQVDQLRVASPDCRFDGGGLPFYWLTGVPASESIAWLKTQVTEQKPDRAVLAIALHSGTAADQALDELVAASQPAKVREKTAFWLGNSRGAHGLEVLRRMLANDPDARVREQVVFAVSQSKEPAALATLIEEARNDKTPQVRGKALFWLAQKAANKQAAETIGAAVLNDPERSVKEQAVFALKQLPESQGVPLLINVAKTNPDPAVRKKAMFWLGQSKDPRALDFFAQVLK
jgi:HEAT repeat protein